MTITPLSESDLPQLIALQAELIDEPGDLQKMRELFAHMQTNSQYHLLGAKQDGQLMGSLAGIVCHDLIGRCIPFMVIENVIVSKKSRRQGVGKRLMQEIEKIARASECRYIMLVSAVTREQAPAFYRSLGYASAPYRIQENPGALRANAGGEATAPCPAMTAPQGRQPAKNRKRRHALFDLFQNPRLASGNRS